MLFRVEYTVLEDDGKKVVIRSELVATLKDLRELPKVSAGTREEFIRIVGQLCARANLE